MDEFEEALTEMEQSGLIERVDGMISLTEKGKREAFALVETDPAAASFLDALSKGKS